MFLSGTLALIGGTVAPDGINIGLATFNGGGGPATFDFGAGEMLSDTAAIGASSVITLLDLTIYGGTAGRASLSQASIGFATPALNGVPEPSTWMMTFSALTVFGWTRRKKKTRETKVLGDKMRSTTC